MGKRAKSQASSSNLTDDELLAAAIAEADAARAKFGAVSLASDKQCRLHKREALKINAALETAVIHGDDESVRAALAHGGDPNMELS
eukprot:5373815-Prymnesium_polylepis.1